VVGGGFADCEYEPSSKAVLKPKWQVSRSLDCARELLAHGAVWNPSENYDLNSVRRSLLECEPDVTIELLRLHDSTTPVPLSAFTSYWARPG
jgi:hypothetical protein